MQLQHLGTIVNMVIVQVAFEVDNECLNFLVAPWIDKQKKIRSVRWFNRQTFGQLASHALKAVFLIGRNMRVVPFEENLLPRDTRLARFVTQDKIDATSWTFIT